MFRYLVSCNETLKMTTAIQRVLHNSLYFFTTKRWRRYASIDVAGAQQLQIKTILLNQTRIKLRIECQFFYLYIYSLVPTIFVLSCVYT